MALKLIQSMLTKNRCYKDADKNVPKRIVVHSTGTSQSNAKVFINSWNSTSAKVCVHAFIDATGIYQTLPFDYRPWGCGSGPKGSGNTNSIQFEICEPSGFTYGGGAKMVGYDIKKNQSYFETVYNNAVEFCAEMCLRYNIGTNNVICHSEAYRLGIATNHADVMHWFPKHNKDMDDFRLDVSKRLAVLKSSPTKEEEPEVVVPKDEPKSKSYPVKVTDDELNIRKGPGTNHEVVGVIKDKGTYTITSEANGKGAKKWGKLKSGIGWISLDYTKRV